MIILFKKIILELPLLGVVDLLVGVCHNLGPFCVILRQDTHQQECLLHQGQNAEIMQ